MNRSRNALIVGAFCLITSGAQADDHSATLSDGALPVAHQLLPYTGKRTLLMVTSADAFGSSSGWCTFRQGIVPGPGVAGSFEIVAGASGLLLNSPGNVPQAPVTCAPLPNQSTDLTVEANQ